MPQGIVVNPEQLTALKSVFVTESGTITDLTAKINGQLDGTQWEGNIASTFRENWVNIHAPNLRSLTDALQQASVDLQSALDRALSADGQG